MTSDQLKNDQRFRMKFFDDHSINTEYFDWALREIFFSVKRGDTVYWLVRWVPTNDFVGEQYQNEFPLSYEKESVLAPHCKRYLDRAKAKEKLNKKKPEIIKGAWPKYYWNWDQRVVFNLKDLKKDQTLEKYKLPIHPIGTASRPRNTAKQAFKKMKLN